MTFKKGDLLVYSGHPNSDFQDSQGIFHSYHHQWNDNEVSNIIFTSGKMVEIAKGYSIEGWYPVYTRHLQPGERPYDPKQMGDRDDDI